MLAATVFAYAWIMPAQRHSQQPPRQQARAKCAAVALPIAHGPLGCHTLTQAWNAGWHTWDSFLSRAPRHRSVAAATTWPGMGARPVLAEVDAPQHATLHTAEADGVMHPPVDGANTDVEAPVGRGVSGSYFCRLR